jgi:hypothetical protein
MSIYQVGSNGSAPSEATVGDYIVTGGGTYEIVPENTEGASFNKNSGLYSKKVTSGNMATGSARSIDQVKNNYNALLSGLNNQSSENGQINFDTNAWKNAYINKMTNTLNSNYENDLSSLKKAYNEAVTGYEKQQLNTQADYETNLAQLDEDAYLASKMATINAANRGLTSSAQGAAMNMTATAQANKQASVLKMNRDNILETIDLNLKQLANDLNVDKVTLKRTLNANTLAALSDGELQSLAQELDLKKYNATNLFTSSENKKDRQLTISEAQKDRSLQEKLETLSLSTQEAIAKISANSSMSAARYAADLAHQDQNFANQLSNATALMDLSINDKTSEATKMEIYKTLFIDTGLIKGGE